MEKSRIILDMVSGGSLIIAMILVVILIISDGQLFYPKKQLLTPEFTGGVILEVDYLGTGMHKVYIIKHKDDVCRVSPYEVDDYNVGDTIK